jgi:hypothetical protein
MNVIFIIYTIILFFCLVPNILIRIPTNGNKWTVAIVHSLVFGIIFHFTHKYLSILEGIEPEDCSNYVPPEMEDKICSNNGYSDKKTCQYNTKCFNSSEIKYTTLKCGKYSC